MMQVVKRDGAREDVSFDKVLRRIVAVSKGLDVNPTLIAQQTLSRIYNGVRTSELDDQAALLAFSLYTVHYDYGTLAARIAISNHQKNTDASFTSVMLALASQTHPSTGEHIRYVSVELEEIVREHGARIDAYIDYERDFLFDYFGFKTLEKAYLIKNSHGRVIERPQHMWMRVALGIWGNNLEEAFKTYDLMSQKFMTHATPTLFNSGTPRPQLSSCFLTGIDDSISGIYKALSDCAAISKYAGGIGMHIHNIRAKGSLIRGTNGTSNGIVPMLRVFNATARYVDQCFTPTTLVETPDGPRPISEIKECDKVRSSLDTYVNVNKVLVHEYSGKMVQLTVDYGLAPVEVTPEHPLLSIRGVSGDSRETILKKYANGLAEMDYVPAGELRIGDLLVSPFTPCPEYPAHFTYKTVTGLGETQYSGKLYDFEVDAPHDYLIANFGIAHNGGGKRNGSFAIYLEPWHADVEDFLMLKRNTGTEEERARDLFYALWIPDLFMERVEADGEWTLFCPEEAPGLSDVHSDEFRALYEKYEAEGRGRRKVSAQKLWFKILDSQIETGTPYLLYKDAANSKSNQRNLGTIKSSNLCVVGETLILTDRGDIPIRQLAEAGEEVTIWNGEQWSKVTPVKTGTNQLVHLVIVKEERYNSAAEASTPPTTTYKAMECTPYHKFLIKGQSERKDAKDLKPDIDCLETWYTSEGDRVESTITVNGFGHPDAERYADTYCFTEPIRHAGIFNGILAGNCTEIIEYSSPDETAVCNLASIALPAFVDQKTRKFDFGRLCEVTRQVTRNLNRVIDVNFYPTPETQRSNMRHRPIGIGVQGLADVFAMMRLSWEQPAAAELNQCIFEHIYYAALEESAAIAAVEGPYETYRGSPVDNGILQYDMWGVKPLDDALDWGALRAKIATNGIRNSLLLAPMPTASTSQILGYNECIEPMTTNIYSRRTLAGEFIMVNRHLMRDLIRYQLWSEDLKQKIIASNGSIQSIPEIPDTLKALYKTAWEMKQRTLIDMAAARGAFICQSQSLNLFVQDPTYAKLTSMHFYGWKKGLKTGIYYLRTKAPVTAQKFTVDPELIAAVERDKARIAQEDEGCLQCSA
jgi:ribonucleotide reductase alpha subunit